MGNKCSTIITQSCLGIQIQSWNFTACCFLLDTVSGSPSSSMDDGVSPAKALMSAYEDINEGTSSILNTVHSSGQEEGPCRVTELLFLLIYLFFTIN